MRVRMAVVGSRITHGNGFRGAVPKLHLGDEDAFAAVDIGNHLAAVLVLCLQPVAVYQVILQLNPVIGLLLFD